MSTTLSQTQTQKHHHAHAHAHTGGEKEKRARNFHNLLQHKNAFGGGNEIARNSTIQPSNEWHGKRDNGIRTVDQKPHRNLHRLNKRKFVQQHTDTLLQLLSAVPPNNVKDVCCSLPTAGAKVRTKGKIHINTACTD